MALVLSTRLSADFTRSLRIYIIFLTTQCTNGTIKNIVNIPTKLATPNSNTNNIPTIIIANGQLQL